MRTCDWQSPESYPGKGDGGYSCGKPAMSECSECGQDFCNVHIYFCEDCKFWMCGCCAGGHVCKKRPQPEGPDVIQQCVDTVERVCG